MLATASSHLGHRNQTSWSMRRILIVEDQDLFRDALASLLGDAFGLEVVGVAASIQEARRLLVELKPDVALADLMLDDGSATELLRFVRTGRLKTRMVIVTGLRDTFAATEALAAGADGYVLKAQPVADLVQAIETVSHGRQYVSPLIAARLAGEPPKLEAAAGLDRLSRRESEILRLVAQGQTSREVAGRLHISTKTVETHRTNMNRKLGLRNTVDVLRFAAAHGIEILETSAPAEMAAQPSGGRAG
jgi:DNA-binding NarL/FixJ family response regulator